MAGYLQIPGISKQFKENISALAEAEIPLSVIIAVYNTAPWLACCLDSLLAQSTDLFEIICINDGSTDESPEILSRYAARDSRIRIINQQNRGLPAARNTGLAAARGKYVTFVDSDDWVEPQTMEKFCSTCSTGSWTYWPSGCADTIRRRKLSAPIPIMTFPLRYPLFLFTAEKKNRNCSPLCRRRFVPKHIGAAF